MASPDSPIYYYVFSLIFVGAIVVFAHRFYQNPEEAWYRGRALAESIKTSTWRFVMRAQPFASANTIEAISAFRNHVRSIIDANKFAGDRLPANAADDMQVTDAMLEIRARSCPERLDFYLTHRIVDQRKWYARKAGRNRTPVAPLGGCMYADLCCCHCIVLSSSFPSDMGIPSDRAADRNGGRYRRLDAESTFQRAVVFIYANRARNRVHTS